MSNEVTTPNKTGLGALGALRTGLANVRAKIPEAGGKGILRMLQEKDGWVFGQEDNALPLGTEVAFNTLSIKHGYVCWTDRKGQKNELLDEQMWSVTTPAKPVHELPQMRDPKTEEVCVWKDAYNADVKIVSGKHAGTELVYKPSSMGGAQAMGVLIEAILQKFDSYPEDHSGPMHIIPIAELQQKPPYNNNSGGKTYPPHFEIVGWMDLEGNEEGADADEPKAVAKAEEAEPEVEAEAEAEAEADTQAEEAPARRRRRA